MAYHISTKCLHLEEEADCQSTEQHYGALSYPIYQSATFAHRGVGESTGYDYSRMQNPTREQLEKIVAGLEQGTDALAFTSGMAAISTLMELFSPGDHIVTDADLYGGSIRLFQNISAKNGICFTETDCSAEDVEKHLTKHTKAIFIETPTNPMMHVVDIQKISAITKKRGILLIVDNTFLSPYLQNPLELGADIVVHSGTKYLGGHNDTLAGFLVTSDAALNERLRYIYKTTGAGLPPFDSWLILRGIKTLALRMEQAQKNAGILARWLQKQSQVTKVLYPGLKDHPGHELMKRQSRGFGAMLTFEVSSKECALFLLKHLRLIRFAESLGGTETLMTYPITQTHADVPPDMLAENGITDRILRLSVGIEDAEDLIQDLSLAFEAYVKESNL